MAVYKDIDGKYVTLKPVKTDDAEFTLLIRQDPRFVKFLPKLNNTIEQQRNWITKQREKVGDYFFVVWSKGGERIGTIGAYNLETTHPETGRLAIGGDEFENSEAMYLFQNFVYNTMNIPVTYGFMYAENKRVIHFSKYFGAVINKPVLDDTGRLICYNTNTANRFNASVPKIRRLIYGEK